MSSVTNNFRSRHIYPIPLDILTSPLPNDTTRVHAILNTRHLYDSCVNEAAIESAGVEAVLSIIDHELGGWPILNGLAWNQSRFNFFAFNFQTTRI